MHIFRIVNNWGSNSISGLRREAVETGAEEEEVPSMSSKEKTDDP